jgi:hypothetical protein
LVILLAAFFPPWLPAFLKNSKLNFVFFMYEPP